VVPQKVKIEISDNVTISLLGLKAGTQEDAWAPVTVQSTAFHTHKNHPSVHQQTEDRSNVT
jgi:hypothetical protein